MTANIREIEAHLRTSPNLNQSVPSAHASFKRASAPSGSPPSRQAITRERDDCMTDSRKKQSNEKLWRWMPHVVSKPRVENVRDLENTTIERCFSECYLPRRLIEFAKRAREAGILRLKDVVPRTCQNCGIEFRESKQVQVRCDGCDKTLCACGHNGFRHQPQWCTGCNCTRFNSSEAHKHAQDGP